MDAPVRSLLRNRDWKLPPPPGERAPCVLVGGERARTQPVHVYGFALRTLSLSLSLSPSWWPEKITFFFFQNCECTFSGDVISTTATGGGAQAATPARERERDERREAESMGLARAAGCGTNHGAEAMAGLRCLSTRFASRRLCKLLREDTTLVWSEVGRDGERVHERLRR